MFCSSEHLHVILIWIWTKSLSIQESLSLSLSTSGVMNQIRRVKGSILTLMVRSQSFSDSCKTSKPYIIMDRLTTVIAEVLDNRYAYWSCWTIIRCRSEMLFLSLSFCLLTDPVLWAFLHHSYDPWWWRPLMSCFLESLYGWVGDWWRSNQWQHRIFYSSVN